VNIRPKSIVAAIVSLASLIVFPAYSAQTIAPPLQSEVLFITPNQALSIPINYSVSAPEDNKEVGLGLRVHFDSSKLSFTSISQALQSGIQPIGEVQDDSNNADNDASTDKFFVLAWVDIAGNWPGDSNVFPLNLFTGDFTANNEFTGSTKVVFTASSTSGGATFNTAPQIICRKPEVSLSSNTSTVAEGEEISLNVVLDQALPEECGSVSVKLNATGTATVGSDYQTFNTDVVFLPNETSVPLTVTTLSDSLIEANETLAVNIVIADNYSLSSSQPTQLDFNISSTNVALAPSISPNTIAETADSKVSTITLVRSGAVDTALDVAYQISGTATQGQDYTLSSTTNTLHFDAGQITASLNITVLSDGTTEADETVTFTLQSSENYPLPQDASVTLTIKDAPEMCIDIDGNGNADALTDGVTLARYMLGYRDATLIENSLANDATRTTATAIQSYIESHLQSGCYDIDGNNNLDALSDAILLIRYLSDYQGDNLIQDAIGENASRTTAAGVSAYIGTLVAQ